MAAPAKGKSEAKAPKAKKKKTTKAGLFELSENSAKSKNKACPKCGPGVYMARHKDRSHCGRCGFTEWN